jgi:hypothetical protein
LPVSRRTRTKVWMKVKSALKFGLTVPPLI